MAQGGRDRRRRRAGGNGRNAETMPQAFRARLGTLDAGVGRRLRPGPEGLVGGFRRRRAERVDELEGTEQLGRDGDLAPVLGAALQGPDPGSDARAGRSVALERREFRILQGMVFVVVEIML